ncbi:MAG: zinc dependent phospholipase C family protein [Planctomycetota bacterium]
MSVLVLLALVAILALSWGPGNHLEFAERVYRRRRELLPARVAKLLGDERPAYFYGNIAADIINFKNYGGHYNHCHRWTVVEDMRENADTRAEEAFCLGYLSHLAADTIAHNHFVPYHLARYARTRGFGHLYWEMYADRYVPESRWRVVTSLKANRELDELDELVNAAVPKKAFSMRTNKLFFNHVLLVAERDSWRKRIGSIQTMASAPLEKGFLEVFRRAAVERIRLALRKGGIAKLAHIDTNGKEAQARAMAARRRVLSQFSSTERRREESEEVAAPFLEGMETPPPVTPDQQPHW